MAVVTSASVISPFYTSSVVAASGFEDHPRISFVRRSVPLSVTVGLVAGEYVGGTRSG